MSISQKRISKLILKKLLFSFHKSIMTCLKSTKFIRPNLKSRNLKMNLELVLKNLLLTSRHWLKWRTKPKKWNVKFLINSSLCSKLLEKLINSWAYDVLEKHENQNHRRIDGFGAYRIHHFNHSKIKPKQSMKKISF